MKKTKFISDCPKSVKILGDTWKIKFCRAVVDEQGNLTSHLGVCDVSEKTLYIRRDQVDEELALTVIHEMIHAVWDAAGLNYEDIPTSVEHSLIKAIESVFRHNKELLMFLTKSAS